MTKNTQEKQKPRRKWWFRGLLKLMKIRYPEPEFIYLGDKVQDGSLILSNHEGTDAPLSLEMYLGKNVTMWGAHEMNEGVVNMYKYQTNVYFHQKKHWNLHLARLFCLIASPLTNLFYAGLDLISTYRDHRFMKTIRESLAALRKGESIVVFPEDSKNGYLAELEGFFAGFVMLAEIAYKQGMDLPIYVSYFKKNEKQYIFDKPVLYSQLVANGETREEVAKRLLDRCNELGKMTFETKKDEQVA